MRGHHTNNFSEACVRVFKDIVLSRFRAYNEIALVDYTTQVFETYFQRRLLNFAHGRVSAAHLLLDKQLGSAAYVKSRDEITPLDEEMSQFLVPSERHAGQFYTADTTIGSCTCHVGRTGQFCKHLTAVLKFFGESHSSFPPVSALDRHKAACLALGAKARPIEFYLPLHQVADNATSSAVSFAYLHTVHRSSYSM